MGDQPKAVASRAATDTPPEIGAAPRNPRPAILDENGFGTASAGNVAVDGRWSTYSPYLQRLIETVQLQWERILTESRISPSVGSKVTVKFVLNDEGKISRIVSVESTSSEAARHACVNAITDRAPYGPWTDDMKAVLGTQQEMTFMFCYR